MKLGVRSIDFVLMSMIKCVGFALDTGSVVTIITDSMSSKLHLELAESSRVLSSVSALII